MEEPGGLQSVGSKESDMTKHTQHARSRTVAQNMVLILQFNSKMLGAGGYKYSPQCPTISLLSRSNWRVDLPLDPVPHKGSLIAQTGVFETSNLAKELDRNRSGALSQTHRCQTADYAQYRYSLEGEIIFNDLLLKH